ncbi:transglycosylase domain-containing protein [Sediminicoccus rosea]|jgi:penicillin-binding protein 1A|uniref:peptidoglycan glycosyltransferase n=1 Tax=Sediminicoccus rosea TaxID=1225128 RepID=A0ABZ0PI76_9PROT|nr:PBP1A family penicillin-binding protein [Sediminicoccus rosea]WPB84981.1 PBP1A family penicillin-binding protein [Sediminicoccus rosea]
MLLRAAIILLIWGLLAAGALLIWFTHDMPRADTALTHQRRPSVTLQTAEGGLLGTQGDLYGETLRLRDLPPHLPAALLAIEDRRFHQHFGLDVIGLARAAYANWNAGEVVQGGSTLTQQLAKNLFLSPARSTRRKVQEALMALWLENRFTKDQLLEIYLNRVYLGGGAYGVDAAARLYFGVSARRLTLPQAAILAGLPQAPSRYSPRANPDGAMARARDVLAAMVATGAITAEQMERAVQEMTIPPRPSRNGGWFADWIFEDIPSAFPGSADLVIRTTLDPRWQNAVESRLAALLDQAGREARVGQGAVVVLDANTGAVRAMAGGRDFRRSPFNRATDARRQPGSTFKAMVYLAALEHGASPFDQVSDGPLQMGRWSPSNGHWRTRGSITLDEAFAHSVNTSAVRVMQMGGGPRGVADVAMRLGVNGRFPRDASIALGTGEVKLIDLAAGYAAMVNGGRRITPYGMQRVEAEGRALPVPRTEPAQVISAEAAERMRNMMVSVVRNGTGRAAAMPGLVTGGKTGTTQDYRDAWFMGFVQLPSGPLVIGVWLGNDDNTGMDDVRGGTLPARLFREIIEAARAS